MVIDDALITTYGLKILLPLTLAFLFFIMWNLAKESKAGKFGTIMIFIILGAGFFSVIIKQVIQYVIEH